MNFRFKNLARSEQGSLFIFSAWVLLILSIFAFSVGYAVRQKLRGVKHLEIRQDLRYIAEAGIKRARAAVDDKDTKQTLVDTVNQSWSHNPELFYDGQIGQGAYSVMKYAYSRGNLLFKDNKFLLYGAVDEESKINLNTLKDPEVLSRLIRSALRFDATKALELAETIMDYIDEDDESYASGAERKAYLLAGLDYPPKNAKLDDLSELLFVKGMRRAVYEELKPYITLYGSGKVNINTASTHVLRAVGLSESLIRKIESHRSGPDRKQGTFDDGAFADPTTIASAIQSFSFLDESEIAILEKFINDNAFVVSSTHFWALSVGKLHHEDEALLIECVFERFGNVKYWREMYV